MIFYQDTNLSLIIDFPIILFKLDELVKRSNFGWISKKLHMRGAYILFNFGVLRYVVIK
jgi:hypothetical protein